jgi:hypothetical protein
MPRDDSASINRRRDGTVPARPSQFIDLSTQGGASRLPPLRLTLGFVVKPRWGFGSGLIRDRIEMPRPVARGPVSRRVRRWPASWLLGGAARRPVFFLLVERNSFRSMRRIAAYATVDRISCFGFILPHRLPRRGFAACCTWALRVNPLRGFCGNAHRRYVHLAWSLFCSAAHSFNTDSASRHKNS